MDQNLTPETVRLAYQLFLGREPESEQMVKYSLTYVTVERLRAAFLRSPEFRGICQGEMRLAVTPPPPAQPAAIPSLPARVPLDASPLNIEWRADAATATALLAHVRDTWTRLGIEQPHWSAFPEERFRPDRIEANEAAFFASGGNDVAQLLAILRRNGVDPAALPRAFEFGCGIGRVTAHLARAFREVTVCDVSASHMAIAQDKVYDSGARNLAFRLADSAEFGMAAPFDLWFSRIVLQHNPPPIIAMILHRAFALLAPGGVAVFQVPTYAAATVSTSPPTSPGLAAKARSRRMCYRSPWCSNWRGRPDARRWRSWKTAPQGRPAIGIPPSSSCERPLKKRSLIRETVVAA